MSTQPGSLPPELNPRGPSGKSVRRAGPQGPASNASGQPKRRWAQVTTAVASASVLAFSVGGSARASHYESQLGRVDQSGQRSEVVETANPHSMASPSSPFMILCGKNRMIADGATTLCVEPTGCLEASRLARST